MLPELGSLAYHRLLRVAAFVGHSKAKKWVNGRKDITHALQKIKQQRRSDQSLIWMHAASLGEFEQGAPVFAALTEQYPDAYFVLTFFSPSGYERRKDYPLADSVLYLPDDNRGDANRWIAELRPSLAIFVKYEFWPYHLGALRRTGVPTALIAASFRPSQPFFQWYGMAWRKLLDRFNQIIVQTEQDAKLLTPLGYTAVVAGDPRADRVLQISRTPFKDDRLVAFCANHKVILAGSVWGADVDILIPLAKQLPSGWRLILAPHQLHESELANWTASLEAIRYTALSGQSNITASTNVMLLDTIGILSKAYRYADLAYVGGGFGSGIHNTLEPMAYGIPVIFGPKYHKFPEAVTTVAMGGSFVVNNAQELVNTFERLLDNESCQAAKSHILNYTSRVKGATQRTLAALPSPEKTK